MPWSQSMPWSRSVPPPLLWLCLGVLVPPCPAAAVQDAAEEPAVRLATILTSACAEGARTAIEQSLQRFQSLQPAPERCPEAWSRHGDSCYFIPPSTTNWRLAHHVCASVDRRARLASIHPGSSQFIETLVESFDAQYGVWVGLTKVGGSWVWSDGSPFDYVNWQPGEPNQTEKCVHMGWPGFPKTTWYDTNCEVHDTYALCQIDLKPSSV